MKTSFLPTLGLALGIAAVLAAPLPAEETPPAALAIPRLSAELTLDGLLQEPVWQQAAEFPFNEPHPKFNETLPDGCEGTVRIWRDEDHLYLGFRIENPFLPLHLKAATRARDGSVYSDECIEVFFDLGSGSPATRQLAANALGSIYDGDFDSGPNPAWDGDWKVAATVVRGAWYSEWKIPHSDLAHAASFRINCARVGHGRDGAAWWATWKAPGWFKPYFQIDWKDE